MKAVVCCTLLAASLLALTASSAVAGNYGCKTCRKAARAQNGPHPHKTYRSSSDKLRRHVCGQCRGVHYRPWHGNHFHTQYGAPVAIVMPPTAELTTNMGWGVSNTRVTKLCHQFARPYPGQGVTGSYPLMPTPRWPSDTTQFGVYPVRAPFK